MNKRKEKGARQTSELSRRKVRNGRTVVEDSLEGFPPRYCCSIVVLYIMLVGWSSPPVFMYPSIGNLELNCKVTAKLGSGRVF